MKILGTYLQNRNRLTEGPEACVEPWFCPQRGPNSFQAENRECWQRWQGLTSAERSWARLGRVAVTQLTIKAQPNLSDQPLKFMVSTSGKKVLGLPTSTPIKSVPPWTAPKRARADRGGGSSGQDDCPGEWRWVGKEPQMPAPPLPLREPQRERDPGCIEHQNSIKIAKTFMIKVNTNIIFLLARSKCSKYY